MGTRIRSEVSKQKTYWLPKHRYLELVHFCLQYPEWKEKLRSLDGYSKTSGLTEVVSDRTGNVSKPVERIVEERMELEERMAMIDEAAIEAAVDLSGYLVKGVTEGTGYELLDAPCCKEVYYRAYRRFFWLLDRTRK